MNEPMRNALRQAEETVSGILALWQTNPPRTCASNGIRLPVEIRELAQVTQLLLAIVGQQQEEMTALKERLGT